MIEVEDPSEEQRFDVRADADVTWLHAGSGERLERYLDELSLPKGEGFVFFAAEAGVVGKARERLAQLGHPGDLTKAANYWRRGVADAHEH